VIDLEEPGASPALRPQKKKRHGGRRGEIIWSYAMDMELMKQFNTARWYGILQHGDKKKRRERLSDIFQHRATTNAKGLKIRALEARMMIIMEETARFIRSDAWRTGSGSDDDDPTDSLDSSIHDRLQNKEQYCRLAKDLHAMKEVIVLVNYIIFVSISGLSFSQAQDEGVTSKKQSKAKLRKKQADKVRVGKNCREAVLGNV
jgi:hypothetical protein